MIYRIVHKSTGAILKSVDTTYDIALRYCDDDHMVVVAGDTLQVDDEKLHVQNGALTRKEGVDISHELVDEGAEALLVVEG